ncbi:MAG TPA: phosphatase PAP2 family protein [Terracidiphilus sp.]|nr:phosphatase PAP2 family protein [Terracidiphilus sp.]
MLTGTIEEACAFESNIKSEAIGQGRFRPAFASFDYGYIAFLSLVLFPAFMLARLPVRMDFLDFARTYWGGTFARSAFVAILLYLLGFPIEQTLMPALRRYQKQKTRFSIALAAALGLSRMLGLGLGLLVTVDALAAAELMERKKEAFEPALADMFWPGLYLFCGVILIFAFNSAAAGLRWAGTYDEGLKHLDWVLFHVNVSTLSHWTLAHAPRWVLSLFELAYFGLFAQMGAALILSVLLGNQRHAVQYVRALLVGYGIALLMFMIFPAKGPYFICPDHILHYPHWLISYSAQQELGAEVRILWAHAIPAGAPTVLGYFISFPCMHIALATICIWFLRPWKRICHVVLAWDAIVLAPAIVLLEWHYMIEMFAGVATAFLAIWISGRVSRKPVPGKLQSDVRALASVGAL